MKFQSYRSIWTSKVGLFNFNKNINMEKVHTSNDDRFILAKITVSAEPNFTPIYILNIYAPADTPSNRKVFFNGLIDYIKGLDPYGDILDSLILAGDFNFQYDLCLPGNAPRKRPNTFVNFTDTFLHDCNNNYSDLAFEALPTYIQGKSVKTLDYIMIGTHLKDIYQDNKIKFMNKAWTNHHLLTIVLNIQLHNTGKGLWRANPNLVYHKSYRKKINSGITHFMQNILPKSTDSDQLKWDRLKGYVKKLTKNYCSNRSSWRQDKLKQLWSEGNTLMRHFKNDQAAMQTQLPKIDQNIGYLQHEMARDAALKAGKRWLVHNENSVGFLKKTAERQLAQRTMDIITHPSSNVPCLSTSDKLDAVQSFYSELYSPEPIHRYSMNKLLRGIQKTISTEDADHII